MLKSHHPYLWMWPYLDIECADTIGVRRGCVGLGWMLNPICAHLTPKGCCPYERKDRKIWTQQKLGGKPEQTLPQGLQKGPTLPATWFQNSGLLNCERILFCCFKPPGWWYFVPAALETNMTSLLVLLKKEALNPNILFLSKKDSVPHPAMTFSSKIWPSPVLPLWQNQVPIDYLSGCVDTWSLFALTPAAQLNSSASWSCPWGRSCGLGAELKSINRPKRTVCGFRAL